MVSLTKSNGIDTFNNRMFIRRFSAMLVPIEQKGNLIMWHLLYNAGGERISYWDAKNLSAASVSLPNLEKSRHIVGWCSVANCYAGKSRPDP
jgi:hypothetical protein